MSTPNSKKPSLEVYERLARILYPAAHDAFLRNMPDDEFQVFLDDVARDLQVSEDDILYMLRRRGDELHRRARLRQMMGALVKRRVQHVKDDEIIETISAVEIEVALPEFQAAVPDVTLVELQLMFASSWDEFTNTP
jgi:hypothetical protein